MINRDYIEAALKRTFPEWDNTDFYLWFNDKFMKYGGEPSYEDLLVLFESIKHKMEQ